MMKKRKITTLLLTVAMLMGCTGCAQNQIPDLTDEQVQQIGEYIAITMMKYDANNRSRLEELDADELLPDAEPTPTSTPEPTPEPQPEGMGPVDDTPVIDGTVDENTASSIDEVYGLAEGLSIELLGKEICGQYPAADANAYFSLRATEGKQLLVLKLAITNGAETEQAVNLLASDTVLTVTVNDEYSRRPFTTMLDDDMMTYVGVLQSGEREEVVLIIEVDENMAENLTTINLKAKNEDKTYTIDIV